MKRTLTITMAVLFAVAGVSPAAPIWSDDFSTTNVTYQNVSDWYIGPPRLHKPTTDWIGVSDAVTFVAPWGELVVRDYINNIRTTAIALDESEFAGVADGTTLQLQLKTGGEAGNYANVYVKVYEMLKDGTGATVGAKNDSDVVGLGGETVNLLSAPTHLTQASTNSTIDVDFTYTTGTDILIVFTSQSGVADKTSWFRFDKVSVIPEPATMGLFAAFGAGIMLIRRRFS